MPLLAGGCGAPGEPVPPRAVVPVAVADLAAQQSGNAVTLTFSLPRKTIEGATLAEPPAIEIYRGFLPAGASLNPAATRMVYTVPAGLVNTYLAEGHVQFTDTIAAAEFAAHSGEQVIYTVRTRAAKKRASAESNSAILRLYPVAERITGARALVTEKAIELAWSAPSRTLTGEPYSTAGYRIYRGELDQSLAADAPADASKLGLKSPLSFLGPATSTSYRDTQFEFGRAYVYSIRSLSATDSRPAESADSVPVIVTPRDVFPPAPPQELVAVFVPPLPDAPVHVELSWGISPETDLAGYRVYRTEEGSTARNLMTPELLLGPTFRDMSVTTGRLYGYEVTAVDRAGNESAPSALVAIDVPKAAL